MEHINLLDEFNLGIDGGGTNTTGVLVDRNGKILSTKIAGPSNPNFVGLRSSIQEIIKILDSLETGFGDISNCNIGLAGYSSFPYRDELTSAISKHKKIRDMIIKNDVEMLLHDSKEDSPIVALICGTGSVAVANKKNSNKLLRVGGWGYLFGDEGSGYAIGRKCLEAITRSADGRSKNTILSQLVLDYLKITNTGELISAIYNSSNPKKTISDLSCIVDKAAACGDDIAIFILEKEADELINISKHFINYFFPVRPNFRISGSVVTRSKLYFNFFIRGMKILGVDEKCIEVIKDPAYFNAMLTARNKNQ